MKNFKLRYQAYLRAERKASIWANILSFIIMLIVFVPFYLLIDGKVGRMIWRILLYVIVAILTCCIGGISDSYIKRKLIRLFFRLEFGKT